MTVFDARVDIEGWWFPLAGLAPCLFILVSRWFARRARRMGLGLVGSALFGEHARQFQVVVLVFALLWTVTTALAVYGRHLRIVDAFEEGRIVFVEGPIESYSALPPRARGTEAFSVAGIRFSIVAKGSE